MSATTSEILEAYTKVFNSDYYKNMERIKAGIGALYKSIAGFDYNVQMQVWKKILNDPEHFINKFMYIWSEFSKDIDYGKFTRLQQFAIQTSKIDMSSFVGLQSYLSELLNTENIINNKLSDAIDYGYETAKEEAGKPEISKNELENVVREEIVNDTLGETAINNSKFKEKFCAFIKFFFVNVILPLVISFAYDFWKAHFGKVIKFSVDDVPVIYEIHNENTYVNIIDHTDKKYRVFFIDDGNVIDGYIDKENIDMNFKDGEDEQ